MTDQGLCGTLVPPQEQFGPEHSTSLRALDMLGHEVFFTSPRLAALSTQAEILSVQLQAAQAAAPKQQLLQAVQQAQQAQQLGGSCSAECGCSQGAAAGMGGGLAASLACRQRMLEEYQCWRVACGWHALLGRRGSCSTQDMNAVKLGAAEGSRMLC